MFVFYWKQIFILLIISDVISYFCYWHFISSWNQTGILHSKQIPVFMIPTFFKVLSVTFSNEHQDSTICYKIYHYTEVLIMSQFTPFFSLLHVQSEWRATCDIHSACINYKPYFTHPTLSACSSCTQHSSVRNPSTISSFTATNSKFFPSLYKKIKLIEKEYKLYTFTCILILNLTMLYSYFHFSIQLFIKHTNQSSCIAKKEHKLKFLCHIAYDRHKVIQGYS